MDNKENTAAYADRGPQFMGSYATRHFYYDVDPKLAKQYNENYKADMKLAIYLIVFAIIIGGLSAWLFSIGGIWMILAGIVTALISVASLLLGIIGIKRGGTPTALLKRGILNAGIIARIDSNGIGVLVLAETTKGDNGAHWGLCSIQLKELPPVHEKIVGEKIPVTCVLSSDRGFNYHNTITSSLIAWGTNSKYVIQQAIDEIDPIEWNALSQCIDRYDFKPEYSETEQLKQFTLKEIIELNLYNAE